MNPNPLSSVADPEAIGSTSVRQDPYPTKATYVSLDQDLKQKLARSQIHNKDQASIQISSIPGPTKRWLNF